MPSYTQSYERIISRNAELIEFFFSNLHPVIKNRIIIISLVSKVINKYPDKILVPYGKIFRCLGGCFITMALDIRIVGVNKVLNKITTIVD